MWQRQAATRVAAAARGAAATRHAAATAQRMHLSRIAVSVAPATAVRQTGRSAASRRKRAAAAAQGRHQAGAALRACCTMQSRAGTIIFSITCMSIDGRQRRGYAVAADACHGTSSMSGSLRAQLVPGRLLYKTFQCYLRHKMTFIDALARDIAGYGQHRAAKPGTLRLAVALVAVGLLRVTQRRIQGSTRIEIAPIKIFRCRNTNTRHLYRASPALLALSPQQWIARGAGIRFNSQL